jgi:hypothetical protein
MRRRASVTLRSARRVPDEGEDDIRSVAVEVLPASVIDGGGARVGVPGGGLDVAHGTPASRAAMTVAAGGHLFLEHQDQVREAVGPFVDAIAAKV